MENKIRTHAWSEKDESLLLEAVEFVSNVDESTIGIMGGKWQMVAFYLKANSELKLSADACKTRFHRVKNREKHKTDPLGTKVVELNGIDFPQEDVSTVPVSTDSTARLEARITTLEARVDKLFNANKQLLSMFEMFGVNC